MEKIKPTISHIYDFVADFFPVFYWCLVLEPVFIRNVCGFLSIVLSVFDIIFQKHFVPKKSVFVGAILKQIGS